MLVGDVKDSTVTKGYSMEIAGSEQSAGAAQTASLLKQVKNLMELQGELIVELIKSSQVPDPVDTSATRGMGARIDIHV